MEFRGIRRVNKPLCGLFSSHYYMTISCLFFTVCNEKQPASGWAGSGLVTAEKNILIERKE